MPGHLAEAEGGSWDACRALDNDLDGWVLRPGVEALGRLVTRVPARAGPVVLTTNFDPLVEVSIRRAGGTARTSVFDGDGSLFHEVTPTHRVAHLHGYWHSADTLHAPHQLVQRRHQLEADVASVVRGALVLAIGYGGGDDLFTRAIASVAADQHSYPEVVWTFFDSDPAGIVQKHARPWILRRTREL